MDCYTLKVSRSDLCRIMMALTKAAQEFRREADAADTDENCRQIAKASQTMWERIGSDVRNQLHEQDEANGNA